MIPEKYRLKNTIKYPTSLIVGGLSKLGLEIIDSLIEQGGYVVIIDTYTDEKVRGLDMFPDDSLISLLDFTAIPHLEEDIRRLDYVFYFDHEYTDPLSKISTQDFLTFSNYLDATLSLASKFDAKFLLTTAIKAHQVVLASQDIGFNYGLGINERHTVYSSSEIQKYAEGLTLDYFERTKLDSRIIRLGEIIGDGIDFSVQSVFVDLILSAARSEPLKLKKDGLETEWYIHVLDAAYGIIKAQFSRNTTGEIYSLSYENAYTNLSVAYKIQELDQDAQEIQFINEKDNLPSLKLYKPAPNLSKIGWSTKILFEKAVKQSLAGAKIYLLENSGDIVRATSSKNTLVNKIKGFLAIADSTAGISEEVESGPISRLIAERKRQEELKKQSIEYAAIDIKVKKRKKPRDLNEKFRNWIWHNFLSIGSTFGFVKNKTPLELTILIVLLTFMGLFYFFVLSPIIALSRDFLIVAPEYQKAQVNLNSNNFIALSSNVSTIQYYLNNTKDIVSKYQGILNFISLNKQYNQVNSLLDNYLLLCDGIKNVSFSLEPYTNYLNQYQNNTQIRSATDSFLSISKPGIDYSNFLTLLNSRLPYLNLGIGKVNKAVDNLYNSKYDYFPSSIVTNLIKFNNKIKSSSSIFDSLDSGNYLSQLLSLNATQSFLIILLDNSKPTPIGGDLSSFAIITLKNAGLSEVVVQSIDEPKFNLSSIDSKILTEINVKRFAYKTLPDLKITDLTSIEDYNLFSQAISKVFEDTYSRKFSGVITLNYSTLDKLLKNLNTLNKSVIINSIKFDDGDFLGHLKDTQNGNESLTLKHSLTAQLLANTLNNYLSDITYTSSNLNSILNSEVKNKNLFVDTPQLDYEKYVQSQDLNGASFNRINAFTIPSFNAVDPKIVNPLKYPSVNSATEVVINSDLSQTYKMNIQLPNIGTSEEVSICLPLNVANANIQILKIPLERTTINIGNTEKCVVYQILTETEVGLNWSLPSTAIQSTNTYAISLSLGKIRGTNMTSDYKITVDPSLTLVSITPNIDIQNNSVIFTQVLNSDQIINLIVKK